MFWHTIILGMSVRPCVHTARMRARMRPGTHSQVGSLAGAAHLLNDDAGVLRWAQWEQTSHADHQKGEQLAWFWFSVGIQAAKTWPIDPLGLRNIRVTPGQVCCRGRAPCTRLRSPHCTILYYIILSWIMLCIMLCYVMSYYYYYYIYIYIYIYILLNLFYYVILC